MTIKTKICTKCNKRKEVNKFGINNAYMDGVAKNCLECANESQKNRKPIINMNDIGNQRAKAIAGIVEWRTKDLEIYKKKLIKIYNKYS